MAKDEIVHMLDQSSGFGVLIGVGALFAIGMILVTRFLQKYLHENANSTENFMVANRSVGAPLVASSVYSSWTWADELLWSTSMVYNYGIMASYWYSAGLAIQICLMTVIGIEAKKKISTSHTSLEIVSIRYGRDCHLLYMFLCLVTNLLACSSMILGASAAISLIAGNLHIVACAMLIPFGVLLYTAVGGLKATFLTDFVHSLILLIVLCYMNISVLTSKEIGGLDGLYNLVKEHEKDKFIKGNYDGSHITGKSQGAMFFGIILTIGNFGLTVMDSSFWQKSFSAEVKATLPGYLTAGYLIFANSWATGSIMGLASMVLERSPVFPTYPRAMTAQEISSGLNLPYTVKALLGNGGLGALLLILYLAVTSTVSAQMISVSSIVSFDIYRKYFKKNASDKQMIKISHLSVLFFGLFSSGFSLLLHYVGVDLTWMGYFLSMVICPGVIPLTFTITWSRQTALAAFISPIIGMAASFAVWITVAQHYYGKISIETLGEQLPCMYSAITALFLPGVLSVIISLAIKPKVFDWKILSNTTLTVKEDSESSSSDQEVKSGKLEAENVIQDNVMEGSQGDDTSLQNIAQLKEEYKVETEDLEDEQAEGISREYDRNKNSDQLLSKYSKIAYANFIFVLLITWVLWPLPLYRDYIWSREYFKGYITVGLIWVFLALLIIGVYPIISGRHSQSIILRGLYKDIFNGKRR